MRKRPSIFRAAIFCLLPMLLAACDRQAPIPEASSPPPATRTWTDIPVAKPTDRVTIHYSRKDENYDGLGLWTWDGALKNTPEKNELAPVGRDDFGPVFQLDRANYGGSERIGFLPRYNHNWDRKDGGDRFWTASLGNEVWIFGGKNDVLARKPDLSPHVESAVINGPTAIVVSLSKSAALPTRVTITDQQNTVQAVKTTFPMGSSGHPSSLDDPTSSFRLSVVPKEPLDVANQHYRIQVEGFGPAVPLEPRGVLEDQELFFAADARLGAAYRPQGTVFRLFAPTALTVTLAVYDEPTGGQGRVLHPLKPQRKGIWEATVDGDLRGKFYAFLLAGPGLDPTREALDPYAVNAVASSTRGRIGDLPVAPRTGPHFESPTDMVIYELHVRDFTVDPHSGVRNRGLYLGFTEGGTRLADDASITTALDHLTELGVTHVELLPVEDFENDEAHPAYSWGYVTTAFFSPEGAYATRPDDDSRVREFKALVDALHARGIGVIMDVVYNHTAGDASFRSVVPGYYYRHLANGALSNGAGCGNEFRTEAPMARKLVVDSLVSWAKAYGVDGFRFDLMALIDQETLRQAERELHAINPGIVLFGEPWSAGGTPLQTKSDKAAIRQLPVGAFNDGFRNALKGSPDGHDAGFIQNGLNREALKSALLVSPWLAAPGQSVNYMTCHDNLVLWDKLKLSMPGASDLTLEDTMKLGYLALLTAQGVPFMQGGEEFARTKGGNNNSYNAPDAINQIDWSFKRKHLGLFTYTRDLIALRKAHPVFRLRTREEIAARLKFMAPTDGKTLAYTLDAAGVPGETWKSVWVAFNSDDQADAEMALPDGQWIVAMDDRGKAAAGQPISGKVSVRRKSGMILFRR